VARKGPVRIDRVVTRGGDGGETSLGDGTRLAKDAPRIEAIGCVDEANAAVGLLRAAITDAAVDAMLARIQHDLFDVGADLCMPEAAGSRARITDAAALRLEYEITAINEALPPLTSFILPGGTPAAAQAHVARTAARRAERRAVALALAEPLNPAIVRYLNRLSDHLFVLARRCNAGRDVLWQPATAAPTR
jgi:cob(I)alamin adenosyltransferase